MAPSSLTPVSPSCSLLSCHQQHHSLNHKNDEDENEENECFELLPDGNHPRSMQKRRPSFFSTVAARFALGGSRQSCRKTDQDDQPRSINAGLGDVGCPVDGISNPTPFELGYANPDNVLLVTQEADEKEEVIIENSAQASADDEAAVEWEDMQPDHVHHEDDDDNDEDVAFCPKEDDSSKWRDADIATINDTTPQTLTRMQRVRRCFVDRSWYSRTPCTTQHEGYGLARTFDICERDENEELRKEADHDEDTFFGDVKFMLFHHVTHA